MLRLILKTVLWSAIGTLAIPTSLILISWNAIPGDSTYKLKVAMEKVMLGVAPSDNLKTTLQIKYTEKRFDEVEKVISTDKANESLANFNNQLMASVDSVQSLKNSEEKGIQAQVLINTLEKVSQKIVQEEQRSQTTQGTLSTKTPTSTPTTVNTAPSVPNPTVSPSSPPSNNAPVDLEETKEKIEEAIEELKKEANNQSQQEVQPQETVTPTINSNQNSRRQSPTQVEDQNDHDDDNDNDNNNNDSQKDKKVRPTQTDRRDHR